MCCVCFPLACLVTNSIKIGCVSGEGRFFPVEFQNRKANHLPWDPCLVYLLAFTIEINLIKHFPYLPCITHMIYVIDTFVYHRIRLDIGNCTIHTDRMAYSTETVWRWSSTWTMETIVSMATGHVGRTNKVPDFNVGILILIINDLCLFFRFI